MLRIYPVSLDIVREVRVLADRIQQRDRDQARQLRRSCSSVPFNIAEGSAAKDGRRRNRYTDALGSARETLANLEVAEAAGYIDPIPVELRRRFDHVIGTLVRNLY
jgi:four helix bundle protein